MGKLRGKSRRNSSKEISSFLSAIETIRQTEKSATSISLASCGLEAVPEQVLLFFLFEHWVDPLLRLGGLRERESGHECFLTSF